MSVFCVYGVSGDVGHGQRLHVDDKWLFSFEMVSLQMNLPKSFKGFFLEAF